MAANILHLFRSQSRFVHALRKIVFFKYNFHDLSDSVTTSVYFTVAAQHPPKQIKFDFYLMHCVTSSIFYRAFMSASWISPENKARLLELKGRCDLTLYASRGSPALLMDDVRNYKVNKKLVDLEDGEVWPQLFAKACALPDDGHASKTLRAIASAQELSKKYEGGKGFRVRGDDWEKLGQIGEIPEIEDVVW